MKIIHITPRYFPNVGGIGTVVKDLCEKLSAKGFEVKVYSLDLNNERESTESINGVLVKRYRHVIGDPFFLPQLSFFEDLRREGTAIIHVHNLQNIFPLFISLAKSNNQTIVLQPHYHRYGQTPLRHSLFTIYKAVIPRVVINRAQVVLANSKYEEELLRADFQLQNNLITLEEGLPLAELKRVKWCPELPERILYVGALEKYKRVDTLLYAFRILQTQTDSETKLVIVGDGRDKQRLLKLAHGLCIAEHIEWKKKLSRQQLLSEYSRASVFVLLSLLESFSISVKEAITIGVPTVVSENKVFSDLVENSVIESSLSDQPQSVAEAILRVKNKPARGSSKSFKFVDTETYANGVA
jgi:1,2-diacylglycerol 3-alpha-glucosyltransferase